MAEHSFKKEYHTGFIKQKQNSMFDFISGCNTVFVEFTTSSNAYNSSPTVRISANKIKIAETNPDRIYYFVFAFTDGLYFIKYSKELFDTFKYKPSRYRQRIDFNDKIVEYYYIPIQHLTQINTSKEFDDGYGDALCNK